MVAKMGRFEHGGDVYSHAGAIDFSASLNPLGMPCEVVEALREGAVGFDAYPDAECRKLTAAIARADGVPSEWVVCTAGATDLIHRVCLALRPCSALVTAPCFSGYEQALDLVGACIVRHALREEDGFTVGASFAEALSQLRPGIAFLCSPNNPTGRAVERDVLMRVLDAAQAAGTALVLDECFLDFTGEPSATALCGRYPKLIVMRAFTKLYAMAGLRLGYGVCSGAVLRAGLARAGQPWAVSAPAQVAGIAALSVEDWAERTRAYVERERGRLSALLEAHGMQVVPSQANYLLFKSPVELYEPLLERGILIRRCANFHGLGEGWYRVAVRTKEENAAFAAALEEVLGGCRRA